MVTPTAGGIERTSTQPGTLMAFESADLYAKVSGYLMTLNVDIGDPVKKGDVLAEIEDPEVHKAVEQSEAALKKAQASVKVAQARIDTAEAEVKASQAEQHKYEEDVKQYEAMRIYRESELDRYRKLAASNSIERKLVDEELEHYNATVSAENASKAAVKSAEAKVFASQAQVQQAQADLEEAKAYVEVAKADLDKAQVIAAYTKITSPYNGVITARNFFRGDFIRSADVGNNSTPLLSVARTDKLRVVVQVPDRDVPFVDRGDSAVVHIDALPGERFVAKVSRFSESEDSADRTMRTEIDLENPDDRLREGMYGNVTIVLQAAEKSALTIPANSLVQQDGRGMGAVYIVRDGKVELRPVKVGKDNGLHVEILNGIQPSDQVVVRYSGSISQGLAVRTEQYKDALPGGEAES